MVEIVTLLSDRPDRSLNLQVVILSHNLKKLIAKTNLFYAFWKRDCRYQVKVDFPTGKGMKIDHQQAHLFL